MIYDYEFCDLLEEQRLSDARKEDINDAFYKGYCFGVEKLAKELRKADPICDVIDECYAEIVKGKINQMIDDLVKQLCDEDPYYDPYCEGDYE